MENRTRSVEERKFEQTKHMNIQSPQTVTGEKESKPEAKIFKE